MVDPRVESLNCNHLQSSVSSYPASHFVWEAIKLPRKLRFPHIDNKTGLYCQAIHQAVSVHLPPLPKGNF